jgi:hypothetical protein
MKKLHNEELIDLYSQSIIWVKNEMGGAYSTYEERRGAYRVLVGKPEGKRLLGRPRCRWEDNIKMELQDVGCEVMDWMEPGQRALVNAVTNLWVP